MMGVYIKGMEMPKGCCECALRHRTFNGEETIHYCYAICEEVYDDGEVNEDCPLIPVPEHRRLIDADALINDHPRTWTTYDLQRIANAPTIILPDPTEKGE